MLCCGFFVSFPCIFIERFWHQICLNTCIFGSYTLKRLCLHWTESTLDMYLCWCHCRQISPETSCTAAFLYKHETEHWQLCKWIIPCDIILSSFITPCLWNLCFQRPCPATSFTFLSSSCAVTRMFCPHQSVKQWQITVTNMRRMTMQNMRIFIGCWYTIHQIRRHSPPVDTWLGLQF